VDGVEAPPSGKVENTFFTFFVKKSEKSNKSQKSIKKYKKVFTTFPSWRLGRHLTLTREHGQRHPADRNHHRYRQEAPLEES